MKTKNITFSEQEARAMYPNASKELREKLEATFGVENLTTDICDIVKTYEDACRINGETPVDDEQMKAAGFPADEIALRKLKTITKALNQGQILSWEDGDQKKWIPWFSVSPSGFSVDGTRCNYSCPAAGIASRLCFVSSELASYAGKQFIDLYKTSIL